MPINYLLWVGVGGICKDKDGACACFLGENDIRQNLRKYKIQNDLVKYFAGYVKNILFFNLLI